MSLANNRGRNGNCDQEYVMNVTWSFASAASNID
jgi:hypothetical protein